MAIDSYGSKITRRDVTELAQASEQLAVVSNMIRSSGVKWGEVAVNLLIVVNNTVVRMQNKGAAAFARYLEKHPPSAAQLKADVSTLDDELNQGRKTPPKKPEED